jgi:hypothetical protein
MTGFPREELEEMMRRWFEAHDRAEREDDWPSMVDFYTDDAVYIWDVGPDEQFTARGTRQLREWAFGSQMEGFTGWRYPYLHTVIDHVQGQVVGIWKQVSPFQRPDGSIIEVPGVGASWFRYAGNYKWSEQRDLFDLSIAMASFTDLAGRGLLNPTLKSKIRSVALGKPLDGHESREHRLSAGAKLKGKLALARIALLGR